MSCDSNYQTDIEPIVIQYILKRKQAEKDHVVDEDLESRTCFGKIKYFFMDRAQLKDKKAATYYQYDMRQIQIKDMLSYLYKEDTVPHKVFSKIRFAEIIQGLNSMYGDDIENQVAF